MNVCDGACINFFIGKSKPLKDSVLWLKLSFLLYFHCYEVWTTILKVQFFQAYKRMMQ